MTLIRSSHDVSKLIGEMKWWENDPDLQRIADALPIRNLEFAYLKKLDALPAELPSDPSIPGRAMTVRAKVAILRRIAAAWFRSPHERLGQMITNAVIAAADVDPDLFYAEDNTLASLIERRYPPRK